MTHFLSDILRQPSTLSSTIEFLGQTGRRQLEEAGSVVRRAAHVYLTGMGSSYHAAMSAATTFHRAGRPVYLQDAAEFSCFAAFPSGSVVVIISRSGESAEILNLLAKAAESKALVVALTHAEASPLAQQAQVPLVIPLEFDHAISVNTYSCLAASATALATAATDSFHTRTQEELLSAIEVAAKTIDIWQSQIAAATWLSRQSAYYFLARGPSLASCNEARLLWEEGVKHPATSMGTANFRHGPQEVVSDGLRFGLWIDPEEMREQDLAVARDLRKLGASVMLIGSRLPADAADLVLQVPVVPTGWQFLLDIIPAQLAAERLAGISEVDCDSFRFCSYIVRSEHGLISEVGKEGDK